MRVRLIVLAFLTLIAVCPRPAGAQWVYNYTWAEPNPFEQSDQIIVHVEGEWDTETSSWPCNEIELDGECVAVSHAAYVWGSDGFYDYDWESDWGWSAGSDWWEFWDLDGAASMEPIGYSTQVAVDYCDEWYQGCWQVTADGYASVEPATVQIEISSDHGDTVWWFNGEDPDSNNFPTSITLTSSAGSQTEWWVETDSEFGQAIELSGGGESVTVTANDVGSGSERDMRIIASVGSQQTTFFMTALLPSRFDRDSGADLALCPWTAPNGAVGWTNEIHYIVRNQLNGPVAGVPYNEFWNHTGSPDNIPTDGYNSFQPPFSQNFNWTFKPPSAATTGNGGVAWDQISIAGSALTVPTVNPPNCGSSAWIDQWSQQWFVGSSSPGSGLRVQTNTLVRYLGRAAHQ